MRAALIASAALIGGCAAAPKPPAPATYTQADRDKLRAEAAAYGGDSRAFEFMRVQGLSKEAAEAKVAAIDEHMRIVNAIEPRLRAEHRGNYVDSIVNAWQGPVCVLMLFRRDGAKILRGHGIDRPTIRALDVPYDSAELHAMMLPWYNRFWTAGVEITPYQRIESGRTYFRLNGSWADYQTAAGKQRWVLPAWLEVVPASWSPPPYSCVAAEAGAPPTPPPPVTIQHPALPTGASMVGTSTFATMLDAPADPKAIDAIKREREAHLERPNWYGSEHGLSPAESAQAQREQGRLAMAFNTLSNRLPVLEPGNYIGSMLRHDPPWSYVFFFRRDPEATLRRYTSEPKFKAELARYSSEERERIIAPWMKRWAAERIPLTTAYDAVHPTMDVHLGIGEGEYRALAASRGWGPPPEPIRLKFSPEPVRPAVDPRITGLLRGFAYERRATLLQLEALGTGKLILRDGCLKVIEHDGAEKVALFHMETGIGLDGDGYLALIDRMTGKVSGRIGEMMAWGRPNAIPENGMVGLEALRAACPGELVNIGNPESYAVFQARYPRVGPATPPPPPPPPRLPQRN